MVRRVRIALRTGMLKGGGGPRGPGWRAGVVEGGVWDAKVTFAFSFDVSGGGPEASEVSVEVVV